MNQVLTSPLLKPQKQPVTVETLQALYDQPLLDLLFQAQTVHRQHHLPNEIQLATLSNIKSGHCPENCKYCPQSAHYATAIETWDLPPLEVIRQQALDAKAQGSSRFCMGAAWRVPPSESHFNQVLEMVRMVRGEGMEACVTLGMLTDEQAIRLKEAGLTAYNHNLDTSPNYYDQIITTRTYEDRLKTIASVSKAGIQVCCGGILGMGETVQHRLEMLQVLCEMDPSPESVPINALVPVDGTPLEDQTPVEPLELIRLIAVTRIVLPHAVVRLSAGRSALSDEAHALCFMAGASSIFSGETLLTTPNPGLSRDGQLFEKLGLHAKPLSA